MMSDLVVCQGEREREGGGDIENAIYIHVLMEVVMSLEVGGLH